MQTKIICQSEHLLKLSDVFVHSMYSSDVDMHEPETGEKNVNEMQKSRMWDVVQTGLIC